MRWWLLVAKIYEFIGLYRLINDRDESKPYLHRYYLLSTRWLGRVFPTLSYRLVLHRCVKSDDDGLHDHPWNWGSKILEGGYLESLSNGDTVERKPGGWRWCKSTDFHRLELMPGSTESWSLFIMGPRQKDWGFLSRDGNWVQWEEYLANRDIYA